MNKIGASGLDAILLCGDGNGSKTVLGVNKVFLRLAGEPLFIHGINALMGSTRVGRVFIIGDKNRLDGALAGKTYPKPVVTVEQWGDLAANAWNGFLATMDGYFIGAEHDDRSFADKVILAMPGDCPLITTSEIDEFLSAADMEKYDYIAGFTPSEVMKSFYPAAGKPGIKMSYFHFREGLFRINNLHLARPFAFHNRQSVTMLYRSRYQRQIKNIIRLAKDLWGERRLRNKIWIYFALVFSLAVTRARLAFIANAIRRFVSIEDVTRAVGDILKLRAGYVITTYGGAALDVDNDNDFRSMEVMFETWKKLLNRG